MTGFKYRGYTMVEYCRFCNIEGEVECPQCGSFTDFYITENIDPAKEQEIIDDYCHRYR